MNTTSVRKEIHDYVDKADKRFLSLVHGMIQAEKQNLTNPDDSNDEMVVRAQKSNEAIIEGRLKKFDEFNHDFEQWKIKKRESLK